MDPVIPPNPQPVAQPPPRSWWSRNWKWFVPTGCLTMIALAVGFFVLIALIVFGAMKSTDVYKEAIRRAKTNPAVIEALGSPIKEGWFMSGKTNVEGSAGDADIAIPISGPKGSGTVYAVATKSAGRWDYTRLEVQLKEREDRIDLLQAEAAESQ